MFEFCWVFVSVWTSHAEPKISRRISTPCGILYCLPPAALWYKFDECRPTLSQHLYLTHSNVCKYCWNHTDFIFEIRIEYTWKSIKTMLRLSWIKIPINTKQDKNESVVCIFCRRFLAITAIPVGLTLYMGYVDDITY